MEEQSVSQLLYGAVKKAYEHVIPNGRYPSVFIFITVNPADIDINIHPAKKEVKFYNENNVFNAIYYSISSTIGKYHFTSEKKLDKIVPSITSNVGQLNVKNAIREHYEGRSQQNK